MNLFNEMKSLVKLSFPIIIGQMGQMLIVAGDVYIATLFSTMAVAGIGVASGIINPIFLFGIGLMMGISPSLAYMRGESELDDKEHLSSILFYSISVGLILTFALILVNKYIYVFGVEQRLIPSITQYISIVAWSIPFAIAFQGVKEYLQAFEKVFIPNLLSILAVLINLVLNYVYVFGYQDIPAYGEPGLAYASVTIRVLLFFALLFYVFCKYKLAKISWRLMGTIFHFSLPIAFMFFLEVLAFCTVSVLSGRLGVVAAAANNIIMTIASVSFMIPLSISSAVAVKIGHAYGKKDYPLLLGQIKAAIILTILFVIFSASFFFLLPQVVMELMTQDEFVVELGVKLLLIVALFQLSDGFQVVLAGVLRGLKETKISSYLVFIGYWVIGIPCGIYLTFFAGAGPQGLWIGLSLALSLVAIALCLLTYKRIKGLSF
ncbi:MAG: MATE family efflux transporter [Bacteriovoracaceae bacterium]|jgi:MATE family multidrug resistance protein|nr:MATE family efflux transporter [Bacteriovoracaceae bacterium]